MITRLERAEGAFNCEAQDRQERFAVLPICRAGPARGVGNGFGPSLLVTKTPSHPPAERGANCHLLIYRLDGVLSVTFVTDCVSEDEAMQAADAIERLGYRVGVWGDGTEIQRQERH